MNLNGKKIVIVGFGSSGLAVARYLSKKQADITVTDIQPESSFSNTLDELKQLNIKTEFGYHNHDTFNHSDLIVVSPGVPHTISPIKIAADKGIPVMGEIELASRFVKSPIIAVTGTNGKTTVTTLIGKLLESAGYKVFVGGNIGTPLITAAEEKQDFDWIVAEISSFQLDTIALFHPKISILLNITDDHQDRYQDFESYANSKARIFTNQDTNDVAIINGNDPYTRNAPIPLPVRKLYFDGKSSGEEGASIDTNGITFSIHNYSPFLIRNTDILLLGKHNLENVSAAVTAALMCGLSFEDCMPVLRNFKGLPHRTQYVDTIEGVDFFNDSKATNTDAVKRALEMFKTRIVLILGGRNKQGDFSTLASTINQHVGSLVLYGEAASEIEKMLHGLIQNSIDIADDFEQAVYLAYLKARPDGIVLLSPGCASFDAFNSYKHRGDTFVRIVTEIKKNCSTSEDCTYPSNANTKVEIK